MALHMRGTCFELNRIFRGVAQLASVLAWGASGRPFESVHPDIYKTKASIFGSLCFIKLFIHI
jgi:hypothetical protein